jgi:hypothetical protein
MGVRNRLATAMAAGVLIKDLYIAVMIECDVAGVLVEDRLAARGAFIGASVMAVARRW